MTCLFRSPGAIVEALQYTRQNQLHSLGRHLTHHDTSGVNCSLADFGRVVAATKEMTVRGCTDKSKQDSNKTNLRRPECSHLKQLSMLGKMLMT